MPGNYGWRKTFICAGNHYFVPQFKHRNRWKNVKRNYMRSWCFFFLEHFNCWTKRKDHDSYVPKLSSCENTTSERNSNFNGIRTLGLSSTGAVRLPLRSQTNSELVALWVRNTCIPEEDEGGYMKFDIYLNCGSTEKKGGRSASRLLSSFRRLKASLSFDFSVIEISPLHDC